MHLVISNPCSEPVSLLLEIRFSLFVAKEFRKALNRYDNTKGLRLLPQSTRFCERLAS